MNLLCQVLYRQVCSIVLPYFGFVKLKQNLHRNLIICLLPFSHKFPSSVNQNFSESYFWFLAFTENPSEIYTYTLDVNDTHSTWSEPLGLMSWADFLNLTFTGTYQWVFRSFLKNRCSQEHINKPFFLIYMFKWFT